MKADIVHVLIFLSIASLCVPNGSSMKIVKKRGSSVLRQSHNWEKKSNKKKIQFLKPHLESIVKSQSGRCQCGKSGRVDEPIESRYRSAYIVVQAKVIRWTENREFTRNGAIPQFAIRNYVFRSNGLYKGQWPRKGAFFQAQGFIHGDSCGLRLEVGRQYLLNLDDPARISPGNIWRRGIFVISRCQSHYNWNAISRTDLRFLQLRSK